MSNSTAIMQVLNATMDAVSTIVPNTVHRSQPTLITAPVVQHEMGVLIGITGNVRGRIIIESTQSAFSKIGQVLFGMMLEGDMLESFVGELGNMIAGNMCTNAFQEGIHIDITPPTVMVGETKLYGFDKAICIPLEIADMGEAQILLILEDGAD